MHARVLEIKIVYLFLLKSIDMCMNDELILWSVFMTGSKTPGMSETKSVIDFTFLTISNISIYFNKNLKITVRLFSEILANEKKKTKNNFSFFCYFFLLTIKLHKFIFIV